MKSNKSFMPKLNKYHDFVLVAPRKDNLTVIIKCVKCAREMVVPRRADNDYKNYNPSECNTLNIEYIK